MGKRKLIDRICEVCGGAFGASKWQVANGVGKYCSRICQNSEMGKRKQAKYDQSGPNNHLYKDGKCRSPEKVACWNKVRRSIKAGKLKRRPCEVCGNEKSHAHHCDYSKPLEIMWLCHQHHYEWHRDNP